MSLEKAEEFLKVAPRCLEEGWYNSAVSWAYYAMVQAARAAFAAVGIHRPWWRRGSLQATFSTELVQRRKLYSAFFVRDLAEAMEPRHSALGCMKRRSGVQAPESPWLPHSQGFHSF